jgi:integrase
VDEGLLYANPSSRLSRQFRLVASPTMRQENIKALTQPQAMAFLNATARVSPSYVPLFLTMARTGMRLGEALGLQWQDVADG